MLPNDDVYYAAELVNAGEAIMVDSGDHTSKTVDVLEPETRAILFHIIDPKLIEILKELTKGVQNGNTSDPK